MKKTLNVGAGGCIYKFYPTDDFECINFDERTVNGIDVIGDVRCLNMFEDEEFDYILASDIIEHFKISETINILTEWKRVLKVGGVIEFRMPNLREICRKYVDGVHNTKLTSWLIFGGQDYPGNFHFVGFDREWFRSIIEPLGFVEIEYKDEGNNFVMKVQRV